MHALYQAKGDAVIGIVADLQDPPELISKMLDEWERGIPVVIMIKRESDENPVMFWLRRRFYRAVNQISNVETYENFTGFGLYDRKAIELIKEYDDPYPYFRGLIAEIGLQHAEIFYDQPRRKKGSTKNNLYSLYDMAMLAVTNLSKVPLRMVTFTGFAMSLICLAVSLAYLVYKVIYWDRFSAGMAPLILGIFFLASIQMIFMGLIGEYIGAIHTLVQHRPHVVEKERMNFEYPPGSAIDHSTNVS
jgi:polyisoprenyl-phosphate glycosyltransferase